MDTEFKSVYDELRKISSEIRELCTQLAVHNEKMSALTSRVHELPCYNHANKLELLTKAITEQAESIKNLHSFTDENRKLIYGAFGFVLVTFAGVLVNAFFK